jgi:protein-disulfide isomerase
LPRFPIALVPVLVIAAILAAVGALGFGTSAGVSKAQVQQEVTELLDGIPQQGSALGSPQAPVTVWVYADLECPTVRLFAENYLPSIIETWVRTGALRIEYRSLQTDTLDEKVFFEQERAALSAGRQDRMWNFVLTFALQQGEVRTGYVDAEFLADIATLVPRLDLSRWEREREDARLSTRVARSVYSAHSLGVRSTPSLTIGFTEGVVSRNIDRRSARDEIAASLGRVVAALKEESREDFPTVQTVGQGLIGGLAPPP